ncbi:hypothetical protein [Streptomyces sp. NPDC001250]|uniref:hypothetical protein n=1 Tax=Streptomyces sp. NPDC001250 TaxID=3154382 RepID=UPI003321768F
MQLKSLEDTLAEARVLDGEYDNYDAAKARRRIAKEVSRSRWDGLFELRVPRVVVQRRCGDPALSRLGHDAERRRTPRHAQAAMDLHVLSSFVIHDQDASSYVSRLVNDRGIEPDGALIFACLLDLAQHEEGAQFWWQFAAGAGSATSAYCLYLLHLRRGELRDAEHWARQIEQLDHEPNQYRPQIEELRVWPGQSQAEDLPHSHTVLRKTVDELDTSCDDDYGQVPQPDPALAERLEELATAC